MTKLILSMTNDWLIKPHVNDWNDSNYSIKMTQTYYKY